MIFMVIIYTDGVKQEHSVDPGAAKGKKVCSFFPLVKPALRYADRGLAW